MTAAAFGPLADTPSPGRRKVWMRSKEARGLALISPTFLYALALLFLPVLIVIAYSFWTQNYLDIDRTFTLENYRQALTEPIYRDLFVRSLWISLTVSIVTVVFSYPIAWFISFHGGVHKNLWLFLVTVPCWTSYLLRVMSWKVILGYGGVLNTGLISMGLIDKPLTSLVYNSNAVVITLVHSWAAFAILPIYVSLQKIDRTLIEAARDLGDSRFRAFLRITLPLSLPGIISAFLIVMIPTVGDYVTPRLVGGKDGVMIATAIQAQFGKAANWPLGAALSVTTMVLVSLTAAAVVLALKFAVRRIR
ncbi:MULTISPECIES: ABC transporter permease [unclassified Shinella]|uniref:ABC transporter permease n=1 Tax=unclassified Shinella TaxID=2643062 RepID=UPI00234F3D25|nr:MULTISPECIES: ABC transporter permease [unclassified Shinella]MCO5149478.1 ABC transporter permease [Shinella sp.]MDC7262617.1 ABC transporter permease [Shinella sp. HY16]MDC7269512.1 ABC transporter permease [Shinella sp. YZ44]